MGAKTAIGWTDHTFNPWWGCTKISPACDHCYAEAWAKRTGFPVWGADAPRRVFDWDGRDIKHWNEPLGWNRKAGERGVRERVFCASMADVFENHPTAEEERPKLWTLIHKTPNLDWQLLTKRVGNVARMVPPSWMNGHWPAHAWLGITVVNQEEADRDIPKLLAMPARVRFLSCEPLLGPIDIAVWLYANRARMTGDSGPVEVREQPCLHWVIAGGESGSKARPPHPDWFRSLRDQCAAAGVAFHFKQWGEWSLVGPANAHTCAVDLQGRVADGVLRQNFPKGATSADGWQTMYRVGKKAAGRELDGRTHEEFPR